MGGAENGSVLHATVHVVQKFDTHTHMHITKEIVEYYKIRYFTIFSQLELCCVSILLLPFLIDAKVSTGTDMPSSF